VAKTDKAARRVAKLLELVSHFHFSSLSSCSVAFPIDSLMIGQIFLFFGKERFCVERALRLQPT